MGLESAVETIVTQVEDGIKRTENFVSDASRHLLDEVYRQSSEIRSGLANKETRSQEGALLRHDNNGDLKSFTTDSGRKFNLERENGSIKKITAADASFEIYNLKDGHAIKYRNGDVERLSKISVDSARGDLFIEKENGDKVIFFGNGATIEESMKGKQKVVTQADGSKWEFMYFRGENLPSQVKTPDGQTWMMSVRADNINLYFDPCAPSSSHYGNEVAAGLEIGKRGAVSFIPLNGFEAPPNSILEVLKPFIDYKLNKNNMKVVCGADGSKKVVPIKTL